MSSRSNPRRIPTVLGALAIAAAAQATVASTPISITPVNSSANVTPRFLGYNMGHYVSGGNTSAWLQYSDVNAFRLWAASNTLEGTDDNGVYGDNVTSLAEFNTRKAAIRANPDNPGNDSNGVAYINWTYFNNRFQNTTYNTGPNKGTYNFDLTELQKLGLDTVVQSTRSLSNDYTAGNGWGGKFEQWQYYYAVAYYSAKNFDTQRYQMYNEPDLAIGAAGEAEWLDRLHVMSDAVKSAIADVDRIYNKKLVADIYAPVAASTTGHFPTWGTDALNQNRTDFAGNPTTEDVFNTYDIHRYGSTSTSQPGNSYASDQTFFDTNIPLQNASHQNMPLVYTEFNRFNTSTYAGRSDNLDTSTVYTEFANLLIGAMTQDPKGMYAFKFNQTVSGGATEKTGFYYVDNTTPYNTTGATQGAEVYRLAAKALKGQRPRLTTGQNAGTGTYDYITSFDPVKQNYYYYASNRNAAGAANGYDVTLNVNSWNVAAGQVVGIEEVSDNSHGQVTRFMTVPANKILTFTQPAQSVYLATIPGGTATQTNVNLSAAADAQVSHATPTSNFGSLTTSKVDRSAATTSDDAAYLKFNLGANDKAKIGRAYLMVTGSNSTDTEPAYVYGIKNDAWTEGGINWNNAPDLVGAADAKLANVGTDAFPVGQLSWNTSAAEWGVDVTDFVRSHPDLDLSFVLIREQRFNNELAVDTDTSQIVVNTRENATGQPRLSLYMTANAIHYWATNFDATMSATTSWDVGVAPNAAGAVGVFGDFITAPHTVAVNSASTVGELRFANVNSYTLSGNSTITLDGGAGQPAAINVYQGSHTIDAPLALATATSINVLPTLSLTLNRNVTGNAALTITGGGRVELAAGGSKIIKATGVSVVGTGTKLDLKDNRLISTAANGVGTWTGSAYTGLTGLIAKGRNGGSWTGDGIVTTQSTATTSNLTTLGIATAAQVKGISLTDTAVWSGQVVTGSDSLVMYTYGGDANLDGKINVDDYTRIDFNVALGTKGWYNGDFNYDGKVNVDDYTIIDFNVGIQGAPFPTAGAVDVGSTGVIAIPEPSSLAILAGGLLIPRRRRRRAD